MTKSQLLEQGRKLRWMVTQWLSNETFDKAVREEAKRLAKGGPVTLAIWVKAAGSAIYPCERCHGSGVYRWGACVNGKPPQHGGICFHCQGKRKMDASDCARTSTYYNHIQVV
jgi:hypothetical protein